MEWTARRAARIGATVIAALVAAPWLMARWLRRQADAFEQYDRPDPELMKDPAEVGPEIGRVVDRLRDAQEGFATATDAGRRRERVRAWLDGMGTGVEHVCEIIPLPGPDVRGEWVVPPGADAARRMLYLHGGAFEAGSPLSHRSLTTRIAEQAGVVVLSLDYRLQPEHDRLDIIDDVDAGWELLCAEGPDGPTPLRDAYIGGDSAGGNLALGLAHRLRDAAEAGGPVREPEAVVAFAPMTDSTFSSPSWRDNIDTDPFLGPRFRPLLDLPHEALVLGNWAGTRIQPDDPRVSPLLDDLHGLPPTLVHVSNSEMLRDDGIRYVRGARSAGSPVRLQVWPDMVHVFQAFAELPEAQEALDEVMAFLDEHRHERASRAETVW